MPFPFVLPTTSSTSLSQFYSSSTHPSLPLAATTHRSVLRDALKKHKRLPPASQPSHLSTVNDALTQYLSYLLVLYLALTGHRVAGEHVSMTELQPLEIEWRLTLSRSLPGCDPERVKLKGIHNELAFVLQTMAYIQVLLSRSHLFTLYSATTPTPEQRVTAIAAAMKHLLDANSIHTFLLSLATPPTDPPPVDTCASTQSALASLTLSEATLIAVLKDDPYTTAIREDRDKNSKEWMISAPSIPKVRAHLFARLCLAAADHAAKASALLSQAAGKLDEALPKYADDLRRTARARAARFLAIDTELSGKTGEAIAWIRGGRKELGFLSSDADQESSKRKGLRGLKQSWAEKRDDRKLEKGRADEWGLDAGRLEEARVLEWLDAKWSKENDTITVQPIPPSDSLLANMPSGRDYHSPKAYIPPQLDAISLARMRAPPDPSQHVFKGMEDDSGDEVESSTAATNEPVGAFPGTGRDYGTNSPAYF